MAAFAQQQHAQAQLRQHPFGESAYPRGQTGADVFQQQVSPGPNTTDDYAGRQGQDIETQHAPHHQAWEQSQMYEYQPQHRQNPHWQQGPSPLTHQYEQGQRVGQESQQVPPPQKQATDSPQRHSSFVGLPPIRRTSTLMSSVGYTGNSDGAKDSDSAVQPPYQDQRVMSPRADAGSEQMSIHQQGQEQGQVQPMPQQFTPGAYHPIEDVQHQMPHGQQSFQNSNAYAQNLQLASQHSPQAQPGSQQGSPVASGPGQSFSGQELSHPQAIAVQNGDPRHLPQRAGQPLGSPQPQLATQGMRLQQPASVFPNAGDQIRLPPRGAWKLEESHLQQPLISPNRNRSSSNTSTQNSPQPYYGFDKETGLPLPSPSTQQQQQQHSAVLSNGRKPLLPAQGQEASQLGRVVSRVDTDLTVDSDLERSNSIPVAFTDEIKGKRNSGLFSGIRERFSKEASDGRRDPLAAAPSPKLPAEQQQQQDPSLARPRWHDAVSESGVATEDIHGRHKRRSFLGIQPASRQASGQHVTGASPPEQLHSPNDDRGNAARQTSQTVFDPRRQQSQMCNAPVTGQVPSQQYVPRPDAPKPSTSFASMQQPLPEQISGQPGSKLKNRFSNLKQMLHRAGQHDQGSGQRPPGSAHSAKPSLASIPQGQPAQEPQGPQGRPSFEGGQIMHSHHSQTEPSRPSQPQPQQQQQHSQPNHIAHMGQQLRQQPQQLLRQIHPGQPQQPRQPSQSPQTAMHDPETQRLQQAQLYQASQPHQQIPQAPGPAPSQVLDARLLANGQTLPQTQQRPLPNGAPHRQQAQQQQLQPTAQQNLQHRFSQLAQYQQEIPQPQEKQQPQLGMMAPPQPVTGRGRSGSAGSGHPFTPGAQPNPMMQNSFSSTNEERGRKPSSGGGFLSSIFSGRSGSKTREPRKEQVAGPQSYIQQSQQVLHQSGQQPGHFGQLGQTVGQQPLNFSQHRNPSPLGQQQAGARPTGQPGPSEQQAAQPRVASSGGLGAGQHQYVQMQDRASGQPLVQGTPQDGAQSGQQMQGQDGDSPPMMAQQQPLQHSQHALVTGGDAHLRPQGQQSYSSDVANGQGPPASSQEQLAHHAGPQPGPRKHQQQQQQQEQQRALGPLNQHPFAGSPHPAVQAYAVLTQGLNHTAMQQSQLTADRRLSASPQLASPVFQLTQSAPFTPVEPCRRQTDSPQGLVGHPLQQQLSGQSLQAPSLTPTAESSPRKPVPASPRRSEPSVAGGEQEDLANQKEQSPSVSDVNSVQGSPVPHSRRPSTQHFALPAGSPLVHAQLSGDQQRPPQQKNLNQTSLQLLAVSPQPGPGQQNGLQNQGQQQGFRPRQTPGASNQQSPNLVGQQFIGRGQQVNGQQGQPLPGPQAPWLLNRTGTGASASVPAQPGPPQPGTPYFQAYPPNNGSAKEQQSSVSKFLKSMTSGLGQDKSEKEKSTMSSMFGLRKHKHSESNLNISHPQPLRGGPQTQQHQGPPSGRLLQASPSQDHLRQSQVQVSGHGPQFSTGPQVQYQQQRQSPPSWPQTGHTPPLPGQPSKAASPQGHSPAQGPPPGHPQQQQQHYARGPEQGGAPLGQFQQSPSSGPGQQVKLLNQHQMSPPAKAVNEHQYGQVPIPGGYGFVRAEGRVEPPPATYPLAYHIGPNGQYLPVQAGVHRSPQPGQTWTQPAATPGQTCPPQQITQSPGSQSPFLPGQQSASMISVSDAPVNTPSFQQTMYGGGLVQDQQPQGQVSHTNVTSSQPSRAVSPLAQDPTPHATPNLGALSPVSTLSFAPGPQNLEMNPDPRTVPHLMNASSSPPQSHGPSSPQPFPISDAVYSLADPAALSPPQTNVSNSSLTKLVSAPLNVADRLDLPSRQPSAISQLSSNLSPEPLPVSPAAEIQVGNKHHSDAHDRSSSLQTTPERILGNSQPLSQHPPPPRINIGIQQPIQLQHHLEQNDFYDATPRAANAPQQQPVPDQTSYVMTAPEEPAEPKSAGPSHEVREHRNQLDRKPLPSQNQTVEGTISPIPTPPPAGVAREPEPFRTIASEPTTLAKPAPVHPHPTSAHQAAPDSGRHQQPLHIGTDGYAPAQNPNPLDVFEEARRKAFIRDMEEKIPVFPTEPDMEAHARAETAAKKKEEDKPQMSATSYPGQEWNPYGEGFDDDD